MARVAPAVAALVVAFVASRLLPRAPGAGSITWWLAVVLSGTATFLGFHQLARRALVLANLLEFQASFPAEAPTRFQVAFRATSIPDLEARLRRSGTDGDFARRRTDRMALAAALGAMRATAPDRVEVMFDLGTVDATKSVIEGDLPNYQQLVPIDTSRPRVLTAVATIVGAVAIGSTVFLNAAGVDVPSSSSVASPTQSSQQPVATTAPAPDDGPQISPPTRGHDQSSTALFAPDVPMPTPAPSSALPPTVAPAPTATASATAADAAGKVTQSTSTQHADVAATSVTTTPSTTSATGVAAASVPTATVAGATATATATTTATAAVATVTTATTTATTAVATTNALSTAVVAADPTSTTTAPTTADPTTADPTTIDPTTIDPTATDPTATDPTTMPVTSDPTTVAPAPTDATTTDPTSASAPATDPTTADPAIAPSSGSADPATDTTPTTVVTPTTTAPGTTSPASTSTTPAAAS